MKLPKHRLLRRRHRLTPWRRCLVDMVDIRSLVMHLLTPDAAAAGLRGNGRYIAVCGADVIPASLPSLDVSAASRACCGPPRSRVNGPGREVGAGCARSALVRR